MLRTTIENIFHHHDHNNYHDALTPSGPQAAITDLVEVEEEVKLTYVNEVLVQCLHHNSTTNTAHVRKDKNMPNSTITTAITGRTTATTTITTTITTTTTITIIITTTTTYYYNYDYDHNDNNNHCYYYYYEYEYDEELDYE